MSKKEKAKLEAEQAETLRIEMEKERLKKVEEDRERKMRERRDAKKKQEQEAVENKLRRVQLRNSSHVFKSNIFVSNPLPPPSQASFHFRLSLSPFV